MVAWWIASVAWKEETDSKGCRKEGAGNCVWRGREGGEGSRAALGFLLWESGGQRVGPFPDAGRTEEAACLERVAGVVF